jgi:hypothetical protein
MCDPICGVLSAVLGRHLRNPSRQAVLISAAAAVIALSAPSASWAQTCGTRTVAGFPVVVPIATAAAVTNSLVSSSAAANTAFLTQNSAFVGAPSNPKPDSQGGGLWIRGVDGHLNATVGETGSGVASAELHTVHGVVPISAPLAANCVSSVHEDFAGFQIGQDISRLNVGGWYIHLGATAGYMETRGSSASPDGNIGTLTQIPFIGSYVAASNGGFVVDGLIRFNDYQTTISAPGASFFDQKFGAHGVTIAGSIGYNWRVPNATATGSRPGAAPPASGISSTRRRWLPCRSKRPSTRRRPPGYTGPASMLAPWVAVFWTMTMWISRVPGFPRRPASRASSAAARSVTITRQGRGCSA